MREVYETEGVRGRHGPPGAGTQPTARPEAPPQTHLGGRVGDKIVTFERISPLVVQRKLTCRIIKRVVDVSFQIWIINFGSTLLRPSLASLLAPARTSDAAVSS